MTERLPVPVTAPVVDVTDVSDEQLEEVDTQPHTTQAISSTKRFSQHRPGHVKDWSWTGRLNFSFSAEGGSFSVQAPTWLARSMYTMIYEKSVGGPQFQLRRYETIYAWSDEVLDIIYSDDPAALVKHLTATGLSIYSRNRFGRTLLYVCYPPLPQLTSSTGLANATEGSISERSPGGDQDPSRLGPGCLCGRVGGFA